MKQPLEPGWLAPSVGAANVPQRIMREDKASARKAAKTDWNAGSVFLVASDPALWGKVVSAASRAGSTLDAALALAQAGVPVFPVSSVGQKKPLNAHGVYSATIDPAVVARDFCQHPNALIAVPMGRRTAMFAIDVDASPPHAHDGIAAWRALEAKHGVTPTRIHSTASGGLHLLFCWPPERPVGCTVKGLPKGVECKGEGGSIIFPPSERGGVKYCVVSDVKPAIAPPWLLDMIVPVRGDAACHTAALSEDPGRRRRLAVRAQGARQCLRKASRRRTRRARSGHRRERAHDWIACRWRRT